MKALTLWQPWASLCVTLRHPLDQLVACPECADDAELVGAPGPGEPVDEYDCLSCGHQFRRPVDPFKTIETRSWPAPKGLIGQRIAIHAAKRPIPGVSNFTDDESDHLWYDAFGMWSETPDPATSRNLVTEPWPLGAVVGSAVLADCVPMVEQLPSTLDDTPCLVVGSWTDRLLLFRRGEREPVDVSDQRPFGLFEPGRWAWLLTDAAPTTDRCPACWGRGYHDVGPFNAWSTPCGRCDRVGFREPIPAAGRQGVWNWEPTS